MHIIFSHGKESGPWGSKIKAMAEHIKSYGDIHSIDYQNILSPDDRVKKLINYIEQLSGDIVLVGSSMGGYVSTIASNQSKVVGLMLLAPAFQLTGYQVSKPTSSCENIVIIHGWSDDIVPYEHSVEFAKAHCANLILVNDGHRLSNSFERLKLELGKMIKTVC